MEHPQTMEDRYGPNLTQTETSTMNSKNEQFTPGIYLFTFSLTLYFSFYLSYSFCICLFFYMWFFYVLLIIVWFIIVSVLLRYWINFTLYYLWIFVYYLVQFCILYSLYQAGFQLLICPYITNKLLRKNKKSIFS